MPPPEHEHSAVPSDHPDRTRDTRVDSVGEILRDGQAPGDGEVLRALAPAAIDRVREWLRVAETVSVPGETGQLERMLRDEGGLEFALRFVDGVVRPEDHGVAAHNLRALAANPPQFLPALLRSALAVGGAVAGAAPGIVVPIARRALRTLVAHLVIDATPKRLGPVLAGLGRDGTRLNLNLLGEAVLGRAEAARRLERTIDLLRRDDVEHVSVKISSATGPRQAWSFDTAADEIVDRLLPLYRAAAASSPQAFINLDMEEYRDLELTIEVFMRLLDRAEFRGLEAGIALQAYVPDAAGAIARLQAWARGRVDAGGAPITVRLVKGANLPLERAVAEQRGWPLATFGSKAETDANYLRILAWALTPERTRNVRIGVAGHNLFDLALAWLLAEERGVTDDVEIEMLLGMAPGQAEAVRRDVGRLVLYTPVVRPAEFDVAISYLVRRLDEAASPENFLSSMFEIATDETVFVRERDRFRSSLEAAAQDPVAEHGADGADDAVPSQNRERDAAPFTTAEPATESRWDSSGHFIQSPDTDPARRENQRWADDVRSRIRNSTLGSDTVAEHAVASTDDVRDRIAAALAAAPTWRDLAPRERASVLDAAGTALERHRAAFVEVAASETGKSIDQSDPEVSEAVDFAHWYAHLARAQGETDGAIAVPARLIVVTPPWNFPIAIVAGQVLAALATGASVIVKPARAAARSAAVVTSVLWDAGVPRDALQLACIDDHAVASSLIADPAVDRVVLTGGYETASTMLSLRPELRLSAETSGKNAIIVTPSADRDLAVRDVVASAFGHAGQKCSAASLVILVGQAGRSSRLRNQLRDAVTSLRVGPPSDPDAQIGPLIAPPAGKLLGALTRLGGDERWVITPRRLDDSGRLWRPGIREGVRRGSEFHRIEYFGPVLGIMTTEHLDEAIEIVNEIEYGLTAGLHSLDPGEIAQWQGTAQAGNLYVNRGITGAIVARQPFGGWKRSSVGATAKVGGPNSLVGLVDWKTAPATGHGPTPELESVRALVEVATRLASADGEAPSNEAPDSGGAHDAASDLAATITRGEVESLERATRADEAAWRAEFGRERELQGLATERNVVRYRPPHGEVIVRFAASARLVHLLRVVAAGVRAGARMRVSAAVPLPSSVRVAIAGAGVPISHDTDDEFAVITAFEPSGRIRLIGGDAAAFARGLGGRPDLAVYCQPATESGRLELLPFLVEQSVSIAAHRYGTPDPAMWTVLPQDDGYVGAPAS